MAFSDRAIAACDKAMENGTMSERHVRDVLRCKNVDVQLLARHIQAENPFIRRAVARIIGKLGDVELLLDGALQEEDQEVLRVLLASIGERGECSNVLERMVNSDAPLVKEEAISMLKRAGKAESLLPLLFDSNDALVNRVKRYINEQNKGSR